ncbi:MAG: DNA polymerase III subunit delta [Actinomycetota bacterium]|nr:DNA polymerase III subunit delta [Actinomycetota bacterium]
MAPVASSGPLVPLTLVVGEEDLLVGRAVGAVLRAARALDPEVAVDDLPAAELAPGDLAGLLSPSLFGDRRVVVLRTAQDMAKEVGDELLAYAADPVEEIAVVVCHAGGAKGKAALAALAAVGARRVEAPRMTKPSDRREFVRAELRGGGRRVSEGAVTLLLDAVGSDLRELCSAASQLLADTTGPIDEEVVARYHRGRAELTGFAVADKAVEGDLAGALELTRYASATGLAPVLVTSALAGALRGIALVAGSRGTPAGQLAAELGMPSWKVDRTRRQSQGWGPEGLSSALRAVAVADADVKGAAVDQQHALERALLAVVHARTGR